MAAFIVFVIPLTLLAQEQAAQSPLEKEILFEAYMQVLSGGVHVGYIISRFERETSSGNLTSTYYLRTNELGGNITESLQAKSDSELRPLEYRYTRLLDNEATTIDARFEGQQMQARIRRGDRSEEVLREIPQGVFLSTFLPYWMIQGQRGIHEGKTLRYQAIAEEEADIHAGSARVGQKTQIEGQVVFEIEHEFNGASFIAFMTGNGQALATRSKQRALATRLVQDPEEATQGLPWSESVIKQLFGERPPGQTHVLTGKSQKSASP